MTIRRSNIPAQVTKGPTKKPMLRLGRKVKSLQHGGKTGGRNRKTRK